MNAIIPQLILWGLLFITTCLVCIAVMFCALNCFGKMLDTKYERVKSKS